MTRSSSRKCACISVAGVVGVAMLAVGCSLISFFANLIHSEVKDQIPLKAGSDSYTNWVSPPVPIYFQVWMYDVVNYLEVMEGQKPFVVQKGPYTYREKRHKEDITFHENGTVSYREIRTFFFERGLSVGPEEDSFFSINIPMVSMAALLYEKFPVFESALNLAFKMSGIELFKKLTVKDLMWGYFDEHLKKLKDFITKLVPSKIDVPIPTTFGLFYGQNGTDDGWYNVYSGQESIDNFGEIVTWNETRSLNYWTSDLANSINGSDGTIYPPFINKSTKYLFSSDLCRSLGMDHAFSVTNRGIAMERFIAPPILFANTSVNPYNAGFCVPAGNCLPSGLLSVSACREGAPIVMSMPNYLGCDQDVIDAVDGVHPNQEEHQSFLDIEPMTGVVMNAGKRLQMNIIVENMKGISSLKNIKKRIYFPILWLNESALIDEDDANKFKTEVTDKIKLTDAVKYGLIVLGAFIILVALAFYVKMKMQKKSQSSESEPLM